MTRLELSGLTCDHCTKAVRGALEGVPGVESAEVTLQSALVKGTASPEALLEAIREEGYEARLA